MPYIINLPSTGGLEDVINQIKTKCDETGVPYVFTLSRRKLGRIFSKKVPISIVGIINHDGSECNSVPLFKLIQEAKLLYSLAPKIVNSHILPASNGASQMG